MLYTKLELLRKVDFVDLDGTANLYQLELLDRIHSCVETWERLMVDKYLQTRTYFMIRNLYGFPYGD